jgi:hypothetical protein
VTAPNVGQLTSEWTGAKHTFEVQVWPDRASMLEHLDVVFPDGGWFEVNEAGERPAGAFVNAAGFMSNEAPEALGTIYLNEEWLDIEIIVHEVAHAAMFVYGCDLLGVYSRAMVHISSTNETFAYLIGDLVAQLGTWLYDAGMYR